MALNFVISTICLDSIKAQTVECVEVAKWILAKEGVTFYWNTPSGDGKARARSICCSRFIQETEAEYLLFIDSDIIFTPRDIKRILTDMQSGYDLIGGIFAVRGGKQPSSYAFGGKSILDGKIHEFEYIASGFMGITRKLLQKMIAEIPLPLLHADDLRFYPFFEEKQFAERESGGIFLSEDYDFCDKARKVGVKPYIDTSVQLGHIGIKVYTLHDMMQMQVTHSSKEIVANQERLKNLRQDLVEYTGLSLDNINRKIQDACMSTAGDWRAWMGTTEDFYKSNKNYLWDDACFNLSEEYPGDKLSKLTDLTGKRILDFGCGIGTACIAMAEQGNEVTGYDINEYTLAFCEFKKKKYNLPITFTNQLPDLSQFDVILAIDVFEHIEDLESTIKMLGKEMKLGARLFHSDAFETVIDKPQHFNHAMLIDGWLKDAGFIVKNERWAIKA